MKFDVVIVGAGPAGLATACRLKQLALEQEVDIEVCVIEKGRKIGSHILSGAIMDTRSLDELFPNWLDLDVPISGKVSDESLLFFKNKKNAIKVPKFFLPKALHAKGDCIVSLGELCCWFAKQAENLGVHIFNGFAATEILFENKRVVGIKIGEKGRDKKGNQKSSFTDAINLRASFCVFSEGSHGHLGKQLIKKYKLSENCTPQHYAIGFKEIWEVPNKTFESGKVVHSMGWPLGNKSIGGGFLYSLKENQVALGLIVDLNYKNPSLSPYDEFQCFKQHKVIRNILKNGKRTAYGARSISKGGYYSLSKMAFPGGFLIGCDAGTFNMAKLKGIHTAMKSGMLAAESIVEFICQPSDDTELIISKHMDRFKKSWLWSELYEARNIGASLHKFGLIMGGILNVIEDKIWSKNTFYSIKDKKSDHQCLKPAQKNLTIEYPAYDDEVSFDISSSLVLANITHSEDQPSHIILDDEKLPIEHNLPLYNEPAQRYCSAGVYEISKLSDGKEVLVINEQNCIHCKVCDIKDPMQNINWFTPEGGSGPNYRNM